MPAIKIEGLRKLSSELKKVSAELPKELNKVGKDAAEIVAVETRSRSPKRTGRLARSVKSSSTARGASVITGSGLVYARPIVYGWRRHNISPNPFPYEALDDRRDEVIERYNRDVAALIDKTVKSGTGE